MGKYHGEWGFRAYSNVRGVLHHSTRVDIGGLRYPPYDKNRTLGNWSCRLKSWWLTHEDYKRVSSGPLCLGCGHSRTHN